MSYKESLGPVHYVSFVASKNFKNINLVPSYVNQLQHKKKDTLTSVLKIKKELEHCLVLQL